MSHTVIPQRSGSAHAPAVARDMSAVAAHIGRYGMHVVHVGQGCDCEDCAATPLPPDQMFGYTIGLTDLGQPELLVRGLTGRETAAVLARWGDTVLAGQVFDAGHLLCEGSGGPTWELVPVRRPSRTLRWAGRYYGTTGTRELSALELIPARRRCPCQLCS